MLNLVNGNKIDGVTPPDKRSDAKVRHEMSGPALKAFFNICENKWQLSVKNQLGLLGWPARATFYKWKKGEHGTLPYDTLVRISLVLGIFKALNILYSEEDIVNNWLIMPNDNIIFSGHSPIDIVMEKGIEGLFQIRRLLDARRGGWN